jgi:hypothetical protein
VSRRARQRQPLIEAKRAAAWAAPEPDPVDDGEGSEPDTRPMCACFPGTCRGGQVVNGKLSNGQCCKAQVPAKGWP